MKKKLLMFALLIAGLTSVKATESTIGIANLRNPVPGYKGSLDVVLTGGDVQYATFQFDITLPEGFTYTGYALGELIPDGTPAFSVAVSNQGNNKTQFIFTSIPLRNFTDKNGALIKLFFTVDAGTTLSEHAGKISWVRASELNAAAHNLSDADFSITATDVVTLYEDETEVPDNISGVKVHVARTLPADRWSTLCLPFAMTEEQADAAFGSDVQIGDFNSYELSGDDDENIKVLFNKATAIEANHPYIIKVSSEVDGFGITDATVDIEFGNNPMVNKGESTTKKKIKAMIGVYKPTDLDEEWIYLNNNTFKWSNGSSKLLPYRAYFRFCDFDSDASNTTSAPKFQIVYNGDGSGTTGIGAVTRQPIEDGQYYDLQGHRVNTPTKGLYIVNGKKVVIK